MNMVLETPNERVVIVRIGKALDFRNAAQFKRVCQEKIRDGALHFILDFTGTGILDSTALGSVFSIYRQVSPQDGQVVFANVSGSVQVVVELTKVHKVFAQYPSVEAAQQALG